MGAPPDSEREAIGGFDCLHRVAQSYLGPLWIAADMREGGAALRLVRRLALPEGTSGDKRRELIALGRRAIGIEHPNVLRVLDAIESGEQLAFAYEQAEAEPLRSLQSWANLRGLSFPVGVALRIMIDLLQGVAAMHALGRDAADLRVAGGLSPDSVLISRAGATALCDPLIAAGAASLEGIGFNTAKLAYAAPEQVRPSAPPSIRADLFTCGAMLWELLASRRLLAGSRPAIERKLLEHNLPGLRASLRNPELVSDQLVALVERALDADAGKRPESAADFAAQLGACGHELASPDDVAAFVGKLSGPRFDRAAAAVRSRSGGAESKSAPQSKEGRTLIGVPAVGHSPASDIETPRGDPFGPSTRRGIAADADDDGPTETAQLPPISFDLPLVGATSTPSGSAPSGGTPAGSVPAGGSPAPSVPRPPVAPVAQGAARWETVPATKKTPPSSPSPLPPLGSRTIVGLGGPDHPKLAPSVPFANLTPMPFSAPKPPGPSSAEPEPSTESAPTGSPSTAHAQALPSLEDMFPAPPPQPERARPINPFEIEVPAAEAAAADAEAGGPLPFQHLLPRGKRASRPPSNDPGSQSWFELHAPANAPRGSFVARHKLPLGLGAGAVLALGAWLVVAARGPAASSEPAAATSERPAATELAAPHPAPEPIPPPAPVARADAGVVASAPVAQDTAPPSTAQGARAADFTAAKLDDSQLVVLFALEGRKTLPSCGERPANKRPANDPRRARQQLDAAQQKLGAGDAAAAYELACNAAALAPNNMAAQRLIAELALVLGDPARAKSAVDKALARTPKDKALIALRGDVLAMMGDVAASRAAWLRTVPARGTKAARTKKLIASSKKLGDKALAASNPGQAAAFYRRAVILSQGAYAQSFGLSEALLGLGRTQAALLWAERAAQALPKDSRWQVLFGDALYQNGQADRARGAWKAALDAQPGNRTAARRVREGKPE